MKSNRIIIGLFAIALVLVTTASASAQGTFYWSGYGSSPLSFDGYQAVKYIDHGYGSYGGYYTPNQVSGGWTTLGSSGSFGYSYPSESHYFGISTRNFGGSYVQDSRGYTSSRAYGGFIVGNNHAAYRYSGYGGSYPSSAYHYPSYHQPQYYGGSYGGYYNSRYW